MHLSTDQQLLPLYHILESAWKTGYKSAVLLGKGVYGRSYGVTFECAPQRAVVKIYNYPNVGDQERRQLIELYAHIP